MWQMRSVEKPKSRKASSARLGVWAWFWRHRTSQEVSEQGPPKQVISLGRDSSQTGERGATACSEYILVPEKGASQSYLDQIKLCLQKARG